MKNIFVLIFILASFSSAVSQNRNEKFYVTAGYNFNFPNASSVNFIIDRYNQTRSSLTTKMDNINQMSGFDVSAGAIINDFILEAGLTFRNSGEKYAVGTFSGTEARRDFKVNNFLVNLGLGYLISSGDVFEFGLGMFLDIGSIKYETRVYNTNDTPPGYTDITPTYNSLALGFTPTVFLNVNFAKNIGISVRPYYFGQIFSQDLTDINVSLNPNTWYTDDPNDYDSETFSGFGIDLKGVVSF